MANKDSWSRAPLKLLILFLLVVLPPAVTLVGLGGWLLQQDRTLARQRQAETLDRAAENAVRALSKDLDDLTKRLAGPSWESGEVPEDSVYIDLEANHFGVLPPGRLPYLPEGPALQEPPSRPFHELEAQESKENLAKALEIALTLAASPDPPLRAGALVREARLLRKLRRPDDALAAYQRLSEIRSVALIGTPVDLLARKKRCELLFEISRKVDLQREALALAADLRSGRWPLDRVTYEQVAAQLSQWLDSEFRAGPAEQALAAGAEWVHQRWVDGSVKSAGTSGRTSIETEGMAVTILWVPRANGLTALVAGPAFLRDRWLPRLQKTASPATACLLESGGKPIAGNPPATIELQRKRLGAETGLPWTVIVTGGAESDQTFAARRRNLLAGLLAVLMLVAAGSYFIWRAISRETAAARLQSDFVSAVSHEFRTPLTTLRQFSEMLVENEELPRETQRRYHAGQVRAVGRLQRLVEALLDFGRMEAGRRPYRMEPIDAASLVKEITEEFRGEIADRGFAIECSADNEAANVLGDAEALTRALYNLLDNAVKYSGDSRNVEVSLLHQDGNVAVAVRDHGIGIPLSEQRRIFQKFVRGTAAKTLGIQGTGIGLAMVRHIVDAHSGKVSVTSTPGAGSTFTIVLPAKE